MPSSQDSAASVEASGLTTNLPRKKKSHEPLAKEQEEISSKFRSEVPVFLWLGCCREGHTKEVQLTAQRTAVTEFKLKTADL